MDKDQGSTIGYHMEPGLADHGLATPRTLTQADWRWVRPPDGGYGTCLFVPSLFEEFLVASGFRNGRVGVPPELPEWAIDETEEQHRKWRRRGIAPEVTYFARALYTGRIKIGRTKQDPNTRVSQLRNANLGEESELLCVRRGEHFEDLYHKAFYTWAVGHEWFAPHPDILAEIARLQSLASPSQ